MSAAYRVCRLSGGMAYRRTRQRDDTGKGRAEICASWRRDRRRDHADSHQEHGTTWPGKAALLIVIAQLIVAYVIELMGLFGVEKEPLEWRKVIGMGIALIGVAIFQWK